MVYERTRLAAILIRANKAMKTTNFYNQSRVVATRFPVTLSKNPAFLLPNRTSKPP